MSCKSAIYAVNTAAQTVAVGEVINFGTISRRFGSNLSISGGNVTLSGQGYYNIDVNVGFTGVAGDTTITLYKDGVAIPGAEVTITTEAAGEYAVTIPAIVRQFCCVESVITAVVTGAAAAVNNAAIRVEKI